jgi:predicted RecB family endonuclease
LELRTANMHRIGIDAIRQAAVAALLSAIRAA